jgi:deazaflavin-dependent oxidoreductase (nitroreductase family)
VSDDASDRKRRRVRWLQRYLLNPPMKLAAWAGLVPGHVLLETTGRRSGKRRRNVVGMHIDDGTGWVVAEHGRQAGYVRNIEANPGVRVRVRRQWRAARGQVVPDDDAEARLGTLGVPGHAAAVRLFGTDLTTIRFDFAPPASQDQQRAPDSGE